MKYFKHKNEFGQEFEDELGKLKTLIDQLYSLKEDSKSNAKESLVRLHESTLESESAYACIESILKELCLILEAKSDSLVIIADES